MNEQLFYQNVLTKAKESGINPLLIISGLEGLYSFRNVQLGSINYSLLDSLILTIFALRIGDQFHALAEEKLAHANVKVKEAAYYELQELSSEDIRQSANPYLQSFAGVVAGKSPVRKYHEKALEVAALEVENVQKRFGSNSIGSIILDICKNDLHDHPGLSALFGE
ncbi:hypothetical protein V9K67_15940 [Paraflavisolibacter sp. H34]|uniref:hypothetical protein n=1 Tax=Huijunlia imazamoxiresistens TaxID=3127457 RepID=UPI00301A04C1